MNQLRSAYDELVKMSAEEWSESDLFQLNSIVEALCDFTDVLFCARKYAIPTDELLPSPGAILLPTTHQELVQLLREIYEGLAANPSANTGFFNGGANTCPPNGGASTCTMDDYSQHELQLLDTLVGCLSEVAECMYINSMRAYK